MEAERCMNCQSRSSGEQSLKRPIQDRIPQLSRGPVKARQKQHSETATWQGEAEWLWDVCRKRPSHHCSLWCGLNHMNILPKQNIKEEKRQVHELLSLGRDPQYLPGSLSNLSLEQSVIR